jgi:hypothetical protein
MDNLLLKKIILISFLSIFIFTLLYGFIKFLIKFFIKKKYSNLLNFINSSDEDCAVEIDLKNININSITQNKLDYNCDDIINKSELDNILNNHIV